LAVLLCEEVLLEVEQVFDIHVLVSKEVVAVQLQPEQIVPLQLAEVELAQGQIRQLLVELVPLSLEQV
jgi:hypothetical protein